MDLQEFTMKMSMIKETLIKARKQFCNDNQEFATELRKAEGFISYVEKYAPNFIKFNTDGQSPIQIKIFESQSKEDMETQVNQFLLFPSRMIIYTGVKGDTNSYFGYILYKDK